MPDFQDKTLSCKDCGRDFVFRAKDQEFFARQGFTDPKRCKPCRDLRKAEKEGHTQPTQSSTNTTFQEDEFKPKKRSGFGGGRHRREDEDY